jgi:hypothetical protein
MVTTFGLVLAGFGTALALGGPATTSPPTTVSLPGFTQLPPATMPPAMSLSALPPTVDATAAPVAAPTVVKHTVRHQPPRAPRPSAAPGPTPAPPAHAATPAHAPAPQPRDAPQQEDAPPSPLLAVELDSNRSLHDDLGTLGERIRSRVDQRLDRLKARLDG